MWEELTFALRNPMMASERDALIEKWGTVKIQVEIGETK
jgi:hypothetical protein